MTTLPAELGESTLGPAMQALAPRWREFVWGKLDGLNNAAAARAAGYGAASDVAAAVAGHRLAHDERVQAAILEESRKLMRSEGPQSIRTLISIRDNPQAPERDRIKASVELMNRAGLHAVSETHAHVHQHVSEAEADRRILALCAELGLSPEDAKKMLVAPAEFQRNAEGVYELAEPHPPSDAPPRRRGRPRKEPPVQLDIEDAIAATAEPVPQTAEEALAMLETFK